MDITANVFQSFPIFSFLQHCIWSVGNSPASQSEKFFDHVADLFEANLTIPRLLQSAQSLAREYDAHLQQLTPAMIPYPPTALSTVKKERTALALDLGGSTLRIAWARFSVDQKPTLGDIRSSEIDSRIRNLPGAEFVSWIMDRVGEAWWDIDSQSTDFDKMSSRLSGEDMRWVDGEPAFDRMRGRMSGASNAAHPVLTIPVAVTWSFPLIQTGVDRAIIQNMGKGFCASRHLCGMDLQDVFASAFEQRALPLRVTAIVNDAVANLAADMYSFASTEYAIIAGTGINASMPITRDLVQRRLRLSGLAHSPNKMAAEATEVFVNMELSMFGKSAFATTQWDHLLDRRQEKPGFQPLEQLCSGRYLGEILRLVLVDASKRQLVFTTSRPESLSRPYCLDTRLMACFESDETADLLSARKAFAAIFPDPTGRLITLQDARQIRTVARLISNRAAAYLGASIVSMWLFKTQAHGPQAAASNVKVPTLRRVAFTGSVLEKYPGFRRRCQEAITSLMGELGGGNVDLRLEFSPESSLVGAAAVAVQ